MELWFDDTFKTEIPMGGSRKDIANAYPDYPDAEQSGFSMAYNYSLREEVFNVTIKIYDNDGSSRSVTRNVYPERFGDNQYLDASDTIDYSAASFTGSGNAIQVTNMKVNGVPYDGTLTWNVESQQFQFSSID